MRFLKTLTFRILGIALVCAVRAIAQQQKSFTLEQVGKMVQAGLGDDSGSKLIEQRGIDFALPRLFLIGGKAWMPISARTPRGGAQCA